MFVCYAIGTAQPLMKLCTHVVRGKERHRLFYIITVFNHRASETVGRSLYKIKLLLFDYVSCVVTEIKIYYF